MKRFSSETIILMSIVICFGLMTIGCTSKQKLERDNTEHFWNEMKASVDSWLENVSFASTNVEQNSGLNDFLVQSKNMVNECKKFQDNLTALPQKWKFADAELVKESEQILVISQEISVNLENMYTLFDQLTRISMNMTNTPDQNSQEELAKIADKAPMIEQKLQSLTKSTNDSLIRWELLRQNLNEKYGLDLEPIVAEK